VIAVQAAALVIVDQLQDRADFLDALSRFVNGLVARRPTGLKFAPCRLKLFSREAPQPVRDRFVRP
jgi:hypothetical protein